MTHLERWLEFPRAMRFAVLLAGVLCLPTLLCGFFADDNIHLGALEGLFPGMSSSSFDLYNFASGVPERAQAMVTQGVFPWWTDPHMKVVLFRPLSSGLTALDHALFARNPVPYHLHQWLWFVGLVGALGLFYRRVLPGVAGGLALVLFAVDESHLMPFGWIASRHALVSALPCVLGLVAHLRWREEGWKPGSYLRLAGFAIGLLGGEGALGVIGYLVAYELAGASGTARARASAVLAPLALVGAYLVLYKALGCGAGGSAAYIDPIAQPMRFAVAALTRIPTLLFDLIGNCSSDLWFVAPASRSILVGGGVLTVAIFGLLVRALYPSFSDKERRALRWLSLGAFLALIPAMGAFIGTRVLLPASIGGAGCLAIVLRHGWVARTAATPRLARMMCGWYALMHLVIAPLSIFVGAYALARLAHATMSAVTGAAIPATPGLDVFVLTASDPMIGFFGGIAYFAQPGSRAASYHLLSMTNRDHVLARTGPNSFELAVEGGRMLETEYEGVFRGPLPRLQKDEVVMLGDTTLRVLALEEGKPVRIGVTTTRPLDDPSYAFRTWEDGALKAVTFPREGETSRLPWSRGPMGL